MSGMKRLIPVLFFAGAALAVGADWLSLRGDTQNSGWQRGEKYLSVRTVGRLHLLWQRKLSDTPDSLTDPLILGPIVTDRGIKELVFVQNTAGSVYAIDADLGQTFWHRSLGSPSACSGGRLVQPTMKLAPNSNVLEDGSSDDDHFSDANRPLYTLSASGRVFPLRASTGDDFSPSFLFLPPGVFPVRMEALESTLDAMTSKTCGGVASAAWTIPVSAAGVPAGRAASIAAGIPEFPIEFQWQWKPWQATVDQNGQPRLLPVSDAKQRAPRPVGSLATWEDEEATRWIYTATQDQIAAFQLRNGNGRNPSLTPSWRLSNLIAPGTPVVANGIVYFLSETRADGPLVLRAINARTRQELYTSKDLITSHASSGNLAIANGHVCFSTTDSQTYCFGLPVK
jgi:outer membrane protein assembly factor BamB